MRLKLSDAIRFARQCGEQVSTTTPCLYWHFIYDEVEL